MLMLHNNLACLASHSAKPGSKRFAFEAVQIEALPDNRYAAAATDAHTLVVVEGPNACPPDEYPMHGALRDAPNGAVKALVPAKDFAAVMKECAAATKSAGSRLKSVAAVMSDARTEKRVDGDTFTNPAQVVLGWTNLSKSNTPVLQQVEGRFPPIREVFPKARGFCRFVLDADLIIRLGETVKALRPLTDANNKRRIDVDFYNYDKPIVLRFHNAETEQDVSVLMMQLCVEKNEVMQDGFHAGDGISTPEFWESEAQRIKGEYDDMKVNRDSTYAQWIASKQRIRELEAELAAVKNPTPEPIA